MNVKVLISLNKYDKFKGLVKSPMNKVFKMFSGLLKCLSDAQNRKDMERSPLILIWNRKCSKNPFCNLLDIQLNKNQLLEIEFFEELGDMKICIQDQWETIVYELQIYTVPTLHIIIEINNWPPGFYSIQISNSLLKSTGFVLVRNEVVPFFGNIASLI